MKRNEMINLIHNTLLNTSDGYVKPNVIGFECSGYGGNVDKLREAAELILIEIENVGMVLRRENMGCGDPECCGGDTFGFDD